MKISKKKESELYDAVHKTIMDTRVQIAILLKKAHNGDDIDNLMSDLARVAPLTAVMCFERTAEPKSPEMPEYKEFVRLWVENCPEIGLQMPKDGAKIKQLIKQTRTYIQNAGGEPSSENAINFWGIFCQNLKKTWAFGRTLSAIEANYPAIIFEMKNGKRKDNYNARTSAQRFVDGL